MHGYIAIYTHESKLLFRMSISMTEDGNIMQLTWNLELLCGFSQRRNGHLLHYLLTHLIQRASDLQKLYRILYGCMVLHDPDRSTVAFLTCLFLKLFLLLFIYPMFYGTYLLVQH